MLRLPRLDDTLQLRDGSQSDWHAVEFLLFLLRVGDHHGIKCARMNANARPERFRSFIPVCLLACRLLAACLASSLPIPARSISPSARRASHAGEVAPTHGAVVRHQRACSRSHLHAPTCTSAVSDSMRRSSLLGHDRDPCYPRAVLRSSRFLNWPEKSSGLPPSAHPQPYTTCSPPQFAHGDERLSIRLTHAWPQRVQSHTSSSDRHANNSSRPLIFELQPFRLTQSGKNDILVSWQHTIFPNT